MAGYGLSQAVANFQQGAQWSQRQDEIKKQRDREAVVDGANKAAAGVIDASKAEWALNGAQGQYSPNDATMFKAAEARGQALAKGGDWENYLKNEATVQQQRIRVRAGALQKYEQDGDFEGLARTAYPSVFDGKEIVGTERTGGMPALPSIGREATPTKFKFKLSDGSTQEVEPEAMVKKLKLSLVDPVKAAEQEVQMNFLRTKAQIEADKQKEIEREKGGQARQTESQKAGHAVALEGVKTARALEVEGAKSENALTLADVNNKAADLRNERTTKAMLGVAGIGANARRYAADQGLAGAKVSADAKVKTEKLTADQKTAKDIGKLNDLVTKAWGEASQGPLGGTRISNDDTMAQARGVQLLMDDDPEMSLSDAIAKVRQDFVARRKPKAK